jgi:plastocyanin
MRPVTWLTIVPVAAVVALAGCGGGSSSGSSSSGSSGSSGSNSSSGSSSSSSSKATATGQTLKLAADPNGQLKFDKSTLSAKSGQLTIAFSNSSGIPHAVEVQGNGVDKKAPVINNGQNSLRLHLKPGKYVFFCPVPGHRQAGMQGTLTVK